MKHILFCIFVFTTAHAVTPTVVKVKAFKDFCERAQILAQQQQEHDAQVLQTFKLSPGDKLRESIFNRRTRSKSQELPNKSEAQHST